MTWPTGRKGLLEKLYLTLCTHSQSLRGHVRNPTGDPAAETRGQSSTECAVLGNRTVGTGLTRI